MSQTDFQIEFSYNGIEYFALVHPMGDPFNLTYRVNLENENQEMFMAVILRQSTSDLEDWDFICGDDEDAADYYDKMFLQEIGEQVEAKIANRQSSPTRSN